MLIWLSLGLSCPMIAKPLTPYEALQRLSIPEGRKNVSSSSGANNYFLKETYYSTSSGESAFYIFSDESERIYIVGGDSRVMPLLGLIDYGTDDLSALPPQLKWLLDSYLREISTLDKDSDDVGDGSCSDIYSVIDCSREEVSPLLVTRWNQDFPYNSLCPPYDGGHAVTGCVATSMAQVMAYHKWPECGRGYIENDAGSFDYDNVVFDWENMLPDYADTEDEITKEQETAVAELMYGCGVAVNMIYTPQISGAYSMRVADALRQYFRYASSAVYKVRDVYSTLEWEDMMYREVAAGRPVIYGGRGASGGHSFVLDGYLSEGLFHFNWGWGGAYDGYFRMSALNPLGLGIGGGSGQFNSDQDAIIGIIPDYDETGGVPPSPLFSTGGFTPGLNFSNKGNRYEIVFTIEKGAIINPSGSSLTGQLGVFVSDGRGIPEWNPFTEVTFAPIEDDGNMTPVTRYKGSVSFGDREVGEYRIYPGFARTGEMAERIRVCDGTSQCLVMTVKEDGNVSLMTDSSGILPDIYVPELGYFTDGMEGKVTFNLVCGETGYEGPLYLTISDEECHFEHTIGEYHVSQPLSSVSTYEVGMDNRPEPGIYSLCFRDALWRQVGVPSLIEIYPSGTDTPMREVNAGDKCYYSLVGNRISHPESYAGVMIYRDGKVARKIIHR